MPTAADRKRREERVKLFAAAVSNVGTAFVIGGVVGPSLIGRINAVVIVASITAGVMIHLAAQGILHYVADDPRPEATTWVGR